jgi:thioredoxin-related protein
MTIACPPFFHSVFKYTFLALLVLTLTFAPALAADSTDGKITALYFYEPTCPFCYKFDNGPLKDPAVIKELSKVEFIKVNAVTSAPVEFMGSKIKQGALAAKYGANFFPTVTFVNAEGKVIASIRGYFETPDFLEMARYVTEGHYKNETFEAYIARKARGG